MMSSSIRMIFSAALLAAGLSSLACDSDGDKQQSEKTIAEALDMRTGIDEGAKEREAFAQEYAENKKKKAADEAAVLEAALERVTTLPKKQASTLKRACDDAADAHREMMKRRYADDVKALQLYLNRSFQSRAEVREKCRLNLSVKSASCYASALTQTDALLYEHVSKIMRRCVKKFGGSGHAGEVARG
jgi:aminopeptidase N